MATVPSANFIIDVEAVEEGRKCVVDLLQSLRAYDVMAESSKVVVYDTALPFKQAYHGLVEHDTDSAPLWNHISSSFAGCFSTADVVDFMRTFYTPGTPEAPKGPITTAFNALTVATWREYATTLDPNQLVSPEIHRMCSEKNRLEEAAKAEGGGGGGGGSGGTGKSSPTSPRGARMRLIAVDPEECLFTISRKLRRHRLHSMAVLDVEQNAVVSLLNHRQLLTYLLPRFVDGRRFFDQPLCLLGTGVFDEAVLVVPESASVISVLNVMWEKKISAVPLVNEAGQVTDLYGRKDICFLANDPGFQVLDAPVGEVRKAQVKMVRGACPTLLFCVRRTRKSKI